MVRKSVAGLWGGLFIVCAGLGFIPRPSAFARNLMTLAAVIFFVPPAVLLWQARKQGDRHTRAVVRSLSLASLGLTVLLIALNIVFATASEAAGGLLNSVLIVVSSPMICGGSWALSLFLWACLLMVSLPDRHE